MIKKVKISVIIPVYNSEKYLERCIESVINQTLEEIEIIVVNDGSPDDSWKIIEDYSLRDTRIVVINKDNGGMPSAMNAALDIAKGEYIQDLGADDWIELTAFKETYEYASKNNLDIVVSDYYRDNGNGKVRLVKDLDCEKSIYSSEEYLECFFQKKSATLLTSKLIKRTLYEGVRRPINHPAAEDLATIPKLTLKADKIGKLERAFYHWMSNPESITRSEPSKKMYQVFEVYDEIEELLRNNGKYDKYKNDLSAMRHFSFVAFLTQKPFYNDFNYKKCLNYMLYYLKQHDTPKNVKSSRHVLVRILKIFPYKVVFYQLNLILRLSPF